MVNNLCKCCSRAIWQQQLQQRQRHPQQRQLSGNETRPLAQGNSQSSLVASFIYTYIFVVFSPWLGQMNFHFYCLVVSAPVSRLFPLHVAIFQLLAEQLHLLFSRAPLYPGKFFVRFWLIFAINYVNFFFFFVANNLAIYKPTNWQLLCICPRPAHASAIFI